MKVKIVCVNQNALIKIGCLKYKRKIQRKLNNKRKKDCFTFRKNVQVKQ